MAAGPLALVLVLVVGIVGGLVVLALVTAVPASAERVEWLAGRTPAPDEAEVYGRYLRRHRRHRLVGGAFGGTLAVVVGVRMEGTVTVGIGAGPPFGDLLFCGLAGVLVGALSAESFRLARPAGPVAASLEARPAPARPDLLRAARVVAAASLGAGVLVLALGDGTTALLLALAGATLVGVAEATQRAITGRRRPVMSERAREVDRRMRAFAGTSVAHLELAAAVLGMGWTLSAPSLDAGPLQALQALAVIACLVVVVVELRRASPHARAPRPLADTPVVPTP